MEWERPRHIHVVYDSRDGITESSVEFDTIEAARDWRNEVRSAYLCPVFNCLIKRGSPAAIFLHRRNRRAVLERDPTDDINGIRINIPLNRVAGASKAPCLSFACMVSITISPDPLAPNETYVQSDASSDGAFSDRTDSLSTENEGEPYVVQVSIIRNDPIWDDFMSHVEKAKAATAGDTTEWPGSRVDIDFDPRADFGQEESDSSGLNSLQRSVARALGLDPTKEFFSRWRCPCLSLASESHVFSRAGTYSRSPHQ